MGTSAFGVYDQVVFKSACSTTETSYKIKNWCWASLVIMLIREYIKDPDQTVPMSRFVCAFVVHMQQKQFSSHINK